MYSLSVILISIYITLKHIQRNTLHVQQKHFANNEHIYNLTFTTVIHN